MVFSEIKGRMNFPNLVFERNAKPLLYPSPCGYRWAVGGTLKNLRTETNIERIRQYHAKFYRPENMIIIVSGHLEKEALFQAIQPMEEEEQTKEREEFEKPFQTPCPNFPKNWTAEKAFEYPDGNLSNDDFGICFGLLVCRERDRGGLTIPCRAWISTLSFFPSLILRGRKIWQSEPCLALFWFEKRCIQIYGL